jgi:hypothetical protein
MNGGANLDDDFRHFFNRQWRVLSRVALEQLARRPFDCKEMQPRVRFTDLDRTYYVRVYDTGTVLSFSHESGNCSTIETKLFSQHLECNGTVSLMRGSVDRRRSAFANLTLDGIPGYL